MCQRCYRATCTFTCPGCGVVRRIHSATRDEDGQPVRCWDCRQDDADAARVQMLVGTITAVEPDLPVEAVAAAVRSGASSRIERTKLAEHLQAYPDGWTAGASSAPRVLWRTILALEAAGASRLVRPRCGRCDRPRQLVVAVSDIRICSSCDRDRRAEPCSRCGKAGRVHRRDDHGGAICRNCHHADPSTWEPCIRCRRPGRVNARTVDGPVCKGCYLPPADRCDDCNTMAPIASRRDGRAVCGSCYRHPRRRCGRCGRIRRISKRARDGQPDLCPACNWAATATCTRCDTTGLCRHANGTGPPVCLRCLAMDKLDALLTGPDGTIRPELAGVRAAFVAAHKPRSLHTWLDRSPATGVLAALATGTLPLTHPALDGLDQTPSLRHLRQLLIACRALPERDPQLARVEAALGRQLTRITHAADRRTLHSWATWQVLARLRRRYPDGDTTPGAAHNAAGDLAEASRFLAHLHDQGRTLRDCRQNDIDGWLAHPAVTRHRIRGLLAWAATRKLVTPGLEVPPPQRSTTPKPMDEADRWALARRCLHDDGLDPADRVVGILVLLYAQPLARISRLQLNDLTVDADGQLFITLDHDRVLMPDPLDGLLRRLPWRRQIGPSGVVDAADQWLFPGRQAGQPIHPDHLRVRLKTLGITTRPARQAALLQLARQVPAPVLADLLGIHITTATAWVARAGGNWNNYAAQRLHDHAPGTPRPHQFRQFQ